METSEAQRPIAWQPLTPKGVAAFGTATFGRLLLVQFLVAVLVGSVAAWFLESGWFPTVRAAIGHLPGQGALRSGRLSWSGDSPQLLAESRFLALDVDLEHRGQLRSPAHVQVEFGSADVWIYSLFGCLQVPYPKGYAVEFNLPELQPWWGAWAPFLLALASGLVLVSLLVSWAALATLYCLPAWLLGLYCDRELTLWGSWCLAGAALMPGALVMTAAIGLYGLGGMDVVRLLGAWTLHLLVGLTYVVWGVLSRPKVQELVAAKANPFARAPGLQGDNSKEPPRGKEASPFSPKP